MIKKMLKKTGKVVKPFVNFPFWMGWKRISAESKGVYELAKNFFSLNKKRTFKPETFDEAKTRLDLSEQDLARRMKTLLQMAFVYLGLGVTLLGYTIYLVVAGTSISGFLLSTMLTLTALAMSYREHFWYFQMKQRRLGCTFKEWLAFTMRGGK